MAFCTKCGAQIEDGQAFCSSCGATAGENASNTQSSTATATDFSKKIAELNNTADTTSEFDPSDINNNKVFAILAYFGILFVVPLLAAPQSKFARYHANQGCVLFILAFAWAIVTIILLFIPVLGGIISALGSLVVIALFVIGIINASNGKAKELPVIGQFKLIK